jgi:hypothetical protein
VLHQDGSRHRPLRAHFVKATHRSGPRYADHTIAIFYEPRRIGHYDPSSNACCQTQAA